MYGKREVVQLLGAKHREGAQWAGQCGHPPLCSQLLFWGVYTWASISGNNERATASKWPSAEVQSHVLLSQSSE